MIHSSSVNTYDHDGPAENIRLPKGVAIFEIDGPLFFGAAYKFQEAIRITARTQRVLIIRMQKVPLIDATGIRVMRSVIQQMSHRGTRLILTETDERILKDLADARLVFAIGKANITNTLEKAIERSKILLSTNLVD